MCKKLVMVILFARYAVWRMNLSTIFFFNANALEQSGLDKVGVSNLTLFLL
jgi:hypothetical protein